MEVELEMYKTRVGQRDFGEKSGAENVWILKHSHGRRRMVCPNFVCYLSRHCSP